MAFVRVEPLPQNGHPNPLTWLIKGVNKKAVADVSRVQFCQRLGRRVEEPPSLVTCWMQGCESETVIYGAWTHIVCVCGCDCAVRPETKICQKLEPNASTWSPLWVPAGCTNRLGHTSLYLAVVQKGCFRCEPGAC